ncbi:MAG: type II toxin-antitoxin system VapC family toxin [Dermatophilaceae bacterium]
MLLADVNVFIYAHRPESADHEHYRDWLTGRLSGLEPFGVSELVLSSFLRIVTNHRVYREPTPPRQALEFCRVVREAPSAVVVHPGSRHWQLFAGLVADLGLRSNDIPDAYLAALALDVGATWITTDRGFARFPGLRWETPLG